MSGALLEFRIWNAPVFAAFVIGVGLRVFLIAVTPVGGVSTPGRISSYNDELAHAQYAMSILAHNALPKQVEAVDVKDALTHGCYENYQPPLYYSILALTAKAIGCADKEDLVRLGRFLGLVLLVGMLGVFVLIGREVRSEPFAISGGLIFLALNGVIVRFTSTVGNDPLFWLAAGGMLLFTLRIHRQPKNWKEWLGFALCCILGIYAKLSTLVVLPILLCEPLVARTLRSWLNVFAVLLLIFLCTLPVWQRNVHEFGSVFPLTAGFGQPTWRVPDLAAFAFAVRSVVFPWTEFWKGIEGAVLMLPMLYILARGCILQSGWRTLIEWKPLGALMMLAAAAFVWLNLRYNQAESRYLFAAWPSLIFLGIGKRAVVGGLWSLLVVLSLPYLLFILP
jgi:hypothetical protein